MRSSKSLDNYIGIDEAPELMYEKCMKVPDALLLTYFRLTSDLTEEQYAELVEKDIMAAHRLYAETIVRMYHGEEAISAAAERYKSIAGGGVPDEMDEYECVVGTRVTDILRESGLAPSGSEARRLMQGGGVKLDGIQVKDPNVTFDAAGEYVVSKGKNKFIKVIVK